MACTAILEVLQRKTWKQKALQSQPKIVLPFTCSQIRSNVIFGTHTACLCNDKILLVFVGKHWTIKYQILLVVTFSQELSCTSIYEPIVDLCAALNVLRFPVCMSVWLFSLSVNLLNHIHEKLVYLNTLIQPVSVQRLASALFVRVL